MVHLTAVTLMLWRKLTYWWLLHNTGASRWRKHVGRNSLIVLVSFLEGSFHVDFLESEVIRFDDNLAVVLCYDVQNV